MCNDSPISQIHSIYLRDEENLHPLAHTPNACNCQGWSSPKPRDRIPPRSPPRIAAPQILEPSLARQTLEQSKRWKPGDLIWDVGIPVTSLLLNQMQSSIKILRNHWMQVEPFSLVSLLQGENSLAIIHPSINPSSQFVLSQYSHHVTWVLVIYMRKKQRQQNKAR